MQYEIWSCYKLRRLCVFGDMKPEDLIRLRAVSGEYNWEYEHVFQSSEEDATAKAVAWFEDGGFANKESYVLDVSSIMFDLLNAAEKKTEAYMRAYGASEEQVEAKRKEVSRHTWGIATDEVPGVTKGPTNQSIFVSSMVDAEKVFGEESIQPTELDLNSSQRGVQEDAGLQAHPPTNEIDHARLDSCYYHGTEDCDCSRCNICAKRGSCSHVA